MAIYRDKREAEMEETKQVEETRRKLIEAQEKTKNAQINRRKLIQSVLKANFEKRMSKLVNQ